MQYWLLQVKYPLLPVMCACLSIRKHNCCKKAPSYFSATSISCNASY